MREALYLQKQSQSGYVEKLYLVNKSIIKQHLLQK